MGESKLLELLNLTMIGTPEAQATFVDGLRKLGSLSPAGIEVPEEVVAAIRSVIEKSKARQSGRSSGSSSATSGNNAASASGLDSSVLDGLQQQVDAAESAVGDLTGANAISGLGSALNNRQNKNAAQLRLLEVLGEQYSTILAQPGLMSREHIESVIRRLQGTLMETQLRAKQAITSVDVINQGLDNQIEQMKAEMSIRVSKVAVNKNNQTLDTVNREIDRLNERRAALKEELNLNIASKGIQDEYKARMASVDAQKREHTSKIAQDKTLCAVLKETDALFSTLHRDLTVGVGGNSDLQQHLLQCGQRYMATVSPYLDIARRELQDISSNAEMVSAQLSSTMQQAEGFRKSGMPDLAESFNGPMMKLTATLSGFKQEAAKIMQGQIEPVKGKLEAIMDDCGGYPTMYEYIMEVRQAMQGCQVAFGRINQIADNQSGARS